MPDMSLTVGISPVPSTFLENVGSRIIATKANLLTVRLASVLIH